MPSRQTLYFTAPHTVERRTEPLPAPQPDEVLVQTRYSAISPGSEMLVYAGLCPSVPDAHDPLSSALTYPTPYGYACVGQIISTGAQVSPSLAGHWVFAFQPHTSHFTAPLAALHFLPADIAPEAACFLPNTETAVNLVQDAAPLLGERALVLGQGIIGLLTTALLARFPLAALVTADRYPLRRAASLAAGATASLDPLADDFHSQARTLLGDAGADFSLEVSGAPAALNDALVLTRFSGRVVIGSWYGKKDVALDLGGAFHRSRLMLIASQVSTIRPDLSARWDKSRRFEVAWDALRRIQPQQWVTHRLPFQRAAEAYRLLHEAPGESIQVIFDYAD
ncbi:MAG: zinc-binding alcohol dehydrogenase [Anaerolineales bacterium]